MREIAERLVLGYGFSSPYLPPEAGVPTTVSPPLYVWLAALSFEIFGVDSFKARMALQLTNLCFQVITLHVLYRCTLRLLSRSAAVIFALAYATNPHVISLASNTWESSTTLLLHSMALHWALFKIDPTRRCSYVVLGGLLGLAALSNPSGSFTYPLIATLVIAKFKPTLGSSLSRGALLLIPFVAITGPWTYRNYLVTGEFVFVRGMMGPELFKGNHGYSYGGHGKGFADYFLIEQEKEQRIYAEMGEQAYDRMMRDKALTIIRENPGRYLKLTLGRIGMWWTGDFDLIRFYGSSNLTDRYWISMFYAAWGTMVSVLALCGTWKLRNRFRELSLLWIYLFLFPVPYYFIVIGFRYQSSVTPFLLIPAAHFLSGWILPSAESVANGPRARFAGPGSQSPSC